VCWFRKRKQSTPKIESKFHKGDYVNFRYKDELYFGWIWTIYTRKVNDRVLVFYDIQLGGQCPSILREVPESKVLNLKKD
jgi:hypothetical protein